jgi:rubrerythrin
MTGIDDSMRKFIEEAIKLEIDGQAFFNHAAAATGNSLGKKMFIRLAQEEVKHLDAFSRLFSSVLKSDDWKQLVDKEKMKGPSSVIQDLAARMKKAESQGDLEALRIGMELELKAIEFFKDCAQSSGDPQAKEMFEKISDEEKFHYDLLQAQHDSLTNSGFWLDSSEFMMDGKY